MRAENEVERESTQRFLKRKGRWLAKGFLLTPCELNKPPVHFYSCWSVILGNSGGSSGLPARKQKNAKVGDSGELGQLQWITGKKTEERQGK
ncbi:hypothetical protein NDU88_006636 [Pleurodeles waltl]|uniref:Uncharacterized protein n=1 Tax=Pleurodeles waltl TaxID=8319 RepID=A0AAV7QIJ8_PLEWA|nr:hypothetical protein NDU88_006636 [Pleurodeles waltl]